MGQIKKTLEKYSNAKGISGHENEIAKMIKKDLTGFVNSFEHDNLGSIAAIKKGQGKGPKIMIAGHIDEIGFMVTKIEKTGYLRITEVGGWWGHVLLGQILTITSRNGKNFDGVVGSIPPHILPEQARSKVVSIDSLFVDIGCRSDEEVKKLGIQLGDPVVPKAKFFELAKNNMVAGKAFDNRCAVTIGIELMKSLKGKTHKNDVYFVGTVQEEVGLRGARTSANKWKPDVAFAIDVTISTDYPGATSKQTNLGDGVALSIMDRSIIGNPLLIRYMEKLANSKKIKFTYDSLTSGGTDAGAIHLAHDGVITMTLSIPSRYIHSHYAVVDTNDLHSCIELLREFILKFDDKELKKLSY